MTIRSFEIFLAVCNFMNMSRAAEALYVTQAAVSHSISAMEKYYGVALFERKSSRLYLTPAGEYLRIKATQVVESLDNIKADISSLRRAKRRIRLGCTLALGEYFIPGMLAAYYDKHRDIEVFLGSYSGHTSEELLMRGELDLILTENFQSSSLLDCATVFNDEVLFVCSRNSRHIDLTGYPSNQLPVVEKETVRGLPVYIQVWKPDSQNIVQLSLQSQGLEFEYMGFLNSFQEILNAVKLDFGIGTISSLALTSDKDIIPFKIKGVESKRPITMAICKNYQLFPELLTLMDFIMGYVNDFAKSRKYITPPDKNISRG